MSVSVGVVPNVREDIEQAARDERALFLMIAAVIAVEAFGLAWFLH